MVVVTPRVDLEVVSCCQLLDFSKFSMFSLTSIQFELSAVKCSSL